MKKKESILKTADGIINNRTEEKERQQIKDIINEVLDEREHRKRLNGPYDVYDS